MTKNNHCMLIYNKNIKFPLQLEYAYKVKHILENNVLQYCNLNAFSELLLTKPKNFAKSALKSDQRNKMLTIFRTCYQRTGLAKLP